MIHHCIAVQNQSSSTPNLLVNYVGYLRYAGIIVSVKNTSVGMGVREERGGEKKTCVPFGFVHSPTGCAYRRTLEVGVHQTIIWSADALLFSFNLYKLRTAVHAGQIILTVSCVQLY